MSQIGQVEKWRPWQQFAIFFCLENAWIKSDLDPLVNILFFIVYSVQLVFLNELAQFQGTATKIFFPNRKWTERKVHRTESSLIIKEHLQ